MVNDLCDQLVSRIVIGATQRVKWCLSFAIFNRFLATFPQLFHQTLTLPRNPTWVQTCSLNTAPSSAPTRSFGTIKTPYSPQRRSTPEADIARSLRGNSKRRSQQGLVGCRYSVAVSLRPCLFALPKGFQCIEEVLRH